MAGSTRAEVRPLISSTRLVALASFVGTTIEWYDFYLYGTAAALVFNQLFFPTYDPLAGTLAAFATYAVGFAARPIGGIVIGHFGDRVGRKSMLVLTLLIMGVATFTVGLLPTYAQIGPWAAVWLVVVMKFALLRAVPPKSAFEIAYGMPTARPRIWIGNISAFTMPLMAE